MVKAGIIGPTKVVRLALQGAAPRSAPHHHRGDGRRETGEGHAGVGGGMGGGGMDF